MPDVKEIINILKEPSKKDIDLITKAFDFAQKAHATQMRFSGDPYFIHVYETGLQLAIVEMDPATIAAGILHDTIEDAGVTQEQLTKEFGPDVAFLVEGVTKLGKLKYRGLDRHAESLRKLFIATAEDARVLIIKLSDRLHNVRTLDGHPRKDKRKRIALETLEIYAPLADRLGMGEFKAELEDAAFPHAYPKEYQKVKDLLKKKSSQHMKDLEKFHRSLQKELAKCDIRDIKTSYRVKHLYSLYKKLKRYDFDIDKVYDITALRVVVPSVADCYRVLGLIHGNWQPLPGRIKDYIALPKPNGYQSIHTTIFTGDGAIVEIQIRTPQMHKDALYGIAAHLAYKSGFFAQFNPKTRVVKKKLEWIKDFTDLQKNITESGELLKDMHMDFFQNRVFIFTPQGDVIDLPEESTPIDFGYAVHSEVGNHTSGAKVNGKLASIKDPLHNGDIVEIVTKKSSHPSRKWLDYAKTALARRHIKNYLHQGKK